MEETIGCRANYINSLDLDTIPNGSFRVPYQTKKSKTVEFFDDLYGYPPAFRVKWDAVDELHEDLFMSYNYRVRNQDFSLLNTLTDFFQSEGNGLSEKTNYNLNNYFKGYLNKLSSTRFYIKSTKKFQQVLQTVPVYTILNGKGEIVLATSNDSKSSIATNLNQVLYNICGSFDPIVDSTTKLGLFFI